MITFDNPYKSEVIMTNTQQMINQLTDYQILTKYFKKNGIITIKSIEQCLFVSMSDIIKKCDAHD